MIEKPFLAHLEDLRWTLFKIGLVLVLAMAGMFFFTPQLLKILSWPLERVLSPQVVLLRALRPASGFLISFKLSFLFGLLLSLPLVIYFLAHFFLPALETKEKKWLVPVCFLGGGLFILGVLFCYFVALPLSLKFLWTFSERLGLANEWTIEYYVTFVSGLILVFGLAFELPIVVMGLVATSLLTPTALRQKRPYAIVIILVAAALLTPPDVLSQILVAVPMILLYEACIWATRFLKKSDKRKAFGVKKL